MRKFRFCMLLAPVLFMFFSTMAEAREAQIVVGFQYSDARDFSEGLAAVKSADLWGYIDATGKETILPAWKAPEVGQFSEGFAFVGNSFIDTIGAAAFDGHTFDRARPFSDGLAAVQSGGQWGFIDTAGRFAILPIYEDAGSFSDGLAPVKRGGLWGFIDRAGRLLITPRYTRAGIFSADGITSSRAPESQSRAAVEYDGKIGYIDKTGRFAVLPKYDEGEEFHNALAPVRGSRSRGDWGYIDTAGREVIPRQFHGAGMFSEGLAPVATDARWGYIDTRGKIVLEPFYDYARPFSEGLAAVERDGKWGYIMIK